MSIIKRNGKWQISVEAGHDPVTGKRKRKYGTAETKKEAKILEAKLIEEYKKGTSIDGSKITLEKHLREWLKEDCADLAPRTYASYKMIVEKHLIPALGKLRMNEINSKHIMGYQNYKLKEGRINGEGGLSARTVQYHHRVLSRALKVAAKWQIIENNPCEYVDAPSVKKPEFNTFSPEQINKIIEIAKGTWFFEILITAIYTGMRRGELLGLRWSDINWDKGEIKVRQQAQHLRNKGVKLRELKTESSKREMGIPDNVLKILKKLKSKQAEIKLQLGKKYKKHDLVFCYGDGSPRNPQGITKKFNNILKEAEISQNYRFHDLRHTFATLSLQEGTKMKTLQKIMGHATYNTTANTYSHVTDKMKKEAVDSISKALKNSNGDNMATNPQKLKKEPI
ncbi:tyrosine-type recombinase/integrase [Iocasia frigidifontis]|nr:site-specific integrase [Iocasia fonsfrigidae]